MRPFHRCKSEFYLYFAVETVRNDHILSIKCPLKQYNKKFEDVIGKLSFWKKEDGNMAINKKSDWFLELQGELHITRRQYGFIMVWLGEFEGEFQYRVVEVPKEDSVFQEMEPKLQYFYNEVMMKELVDPRKSRHMELREYNAEKKSFI